MVDTAVQAAAMFVQWVTKRSEGVGALRMRCFDHAAFEGRQCCWKIGETLSTGATRDIFTSNHQFGIVDTSDVKLPKCHNILSGVKKLVRYCRL